MTLNCFNDCGEIMRRLSVDNCDKSKIRINEPFYTLYLVVAKQYLTRHKRVNITKTCLCNIDPLKPHFYTVKLGFTGVYIIFLISSKNINCEYSLEPPRRGGSNEYSQSMFWAEIKQISKFLSRKFSFFGGEFSVYLNRLVFVMNHCVSLQV